VIEISDSFLEFFNSSNPDPDHGSLAFSDHDTLPHMDYDIDTFHTTNLAIPDTTGTNITPEDPSTDQFDFEKFLFILNDEKTYHYPDDSMKEATNPVIEMPETYKETSQPFLNTSEPSVKTSQSSVDTSQPSVETSQPSVETSQPSVEVPLHTCEVFVPEVNISFTVPVLQTVTVTDRTIPNMDVMARNTVLNTTMKAKKTNNERCKAYRLRKKMETDQKMKYLEELEKRNKELKLIYQCKQEELNAYMKLFIRN